MTLVEPRSVSRHSRRHVLAWAAGATLAVSTTRVSVARQATPEAPAPSTFLDPATIHEIAVTFDQAAYDAMVETFSTTGDKEWIEASVTIDGATYDQAGIRLKGNSSLGGMIGGQRDAPADAGVAATPAAGAESGGEGPSAHTEGEPGGGLQADTPERLPWLIRLDKGVDDQNHQGITDLVVRSNHSATSLNEAVSLDLLDLAGLASQQAAYTSFIVNDSEPVLRLAIELPNDAWMAAHFAADGLLYKAEAGGTWDYLGDDPEAYKDAFDLEAGGTGDDAADYQPLFDFLTFLNDSDDDTFAAEIPGRLDLDAFATYRAMMDLIVNFDDITGPGNNAYLYVGPDSTMFTVVPWDMNLAFGGPGMNGPGGAGPFMVIDGTPVAPGDTFTFPDGANEEVIAIGGTPSADPGSDENRQVGPGLSNILVERCETLEGFTDQVAEAKTRLYADLYESGTASGVLAGWVGLLQDQADDLVDDATIAAEADTIAEQFSQEP